MFQKCGKSLIFSILPILHTPHPPAHADVTLEHLDQEDKV